MTTIRIVRNAMYSTYTNEATGETTVHNHDGAKRRASYGRCFKKASRAGRNDKGKIKSWGLNRCGHRSNPRPK